jgi:hypothetical protein
METDASVPVMMDVGSRPLRKRNNKTKGEGYCGLHLGGIRPGRFTFHKP